MGNSTNTGNAGEYLVLAELLARGHHTGLAERGSPTFDIITRHGKRHSCRRVKTSSTRSFQWTAKGDWEPLPRHDPEDARDFVVLVALNGGGPRGADLYVVPTRVVVEAINDAYREYHNHPNQKNGEPRKWTNQRVLRLDGEDRPDNPSYGFAEKWAEYQDAWHVLEDNGAE